MVDPKGQNILFRNQLAQKEQLIQMQNERLAEQTETIKDLRATVERMTEEIAGLRETVNEFQRMLFGKSSEKTKNNAETEDAVPEDMEKVSTTVKSHTRTTRKAKATREDQYGNLPVHKEVIPLPEEEKQCPYCNSQLELIGETFVREELRITPAKVERIH